MAKHKKYDCIIIGGGHAGIEAAGVCANMGADTLLVTIRFDSIGEMSCNPSIGGIGKGQLTREIDALGGVMALAIDHAGIQFRLLNRSKGPAVQSPRAQADKTAYKRFTQDYLASLDNLEIAEGNAAEILTEDGKAAGIRTTDGRVYSGKAVIVTAGTFLRGLMHIGEERIPGGRRGEEPANELSESLRGLGLSIERLKTGTPVRLDSSTIDYSKTERQDGDENPRPFSFMNERIEQKQVCCWITYTNPAVHELLRENMERAPLYSGQINSTGPRYCPSIETKIMRFPDKQNHQIFIEPETAEELTMYPNGISTSVPRDVQESMLRQIPGFENARVVHYGYAIEYDYCPATQLKITFETKNVSGLYLAGQVCGTSGYEEAAAQGLYAGVNAVRQMRGEEPFIIRRDQAYIGVMVDDLLTKHITEPYRMFTSRAEYRLTLRADNADRRLTPLAREAGLISEQRWQRYQKKIADIQAVEKYLKTTRTAGRSLWQQLQQPDNPLRQNLKSDEVIAAMNPPEEVLEAVMIDAKYEGYLSRQERLVKGLSSLEKVLLPADIDYFSVPHLRSEAKERLTEIKPHNLGQASRIGGITPADITVLQVYMKAAGKTA
ncbi:tRNA uridine-5-carboxymethylaminomethyl(34) synthesis enzyme MnmG [Sedimentisphaera salicampi]|uniref:tRNA uridine 5-carboxymethylaminomethyl modification enzyme MnmG n=1 Tax=Sedimentisphaera salicampi TaxID=1941349 RepID=A0A1W6LLH2_9BACT|nr:tRNA uridine-5-carboxymethylaminomethyl(34) synthesis enzyme MnmG [Sedimentisphaera salicampi]ARN56621.1 Glucose-inhibited division protein A [Sedimentisphaera salicampi]